MCRIPRSLAATLGLLALVGPASAQAFAAGEVYWGPGSCFGPCGLFDVTLGGDQGSATPVAVVDRVPGQIAWTLSPLVGYVSEFDLDRVVQVSPAGAVTVFATGLDGATGLLVDDTGRLLAASFHDGAVYDISAGGDFSSATPFASGLGFPRNLLQLSSGEILVADQAFLTRAIFDITAGGDFSSATPFAFGFPPDGPYDLVEDAAGNIYASSDDGVYDITAGGDISSATPHATGQSFVGLALDASGRLLASVLTSGDVYDISAAGNYASAPTFATNLAGVGDTALDTVPGAVMSVPSLAGASGAVLAGLLALIGAICLRVGARRR
jgi:hypothetical protein